MSGRLKLFKNSTSVLILIKNGDVVYAKMDKILGDNALIAAIYTNFETFSFNVEDVSDELTNITCNQKDLLMIGFLVIDEITHIRQEYGNFLAMKPGFKSITGIQRKVIKKIDGGIALTELLEHFLGDIAGVVSFIKYLINENYLIWSDAPLAAVIQPEEKLKKGFIVTNTQNVASKGGVNGR